MAFLRKVAFLCILSLNLGMIPNTSARKWHNAAKGILLILKLINFSRALMSLFFEVAPRWSMTQHSGILTRTITDWFGQDVQSRANMGKPTGSS